ncbi:MAG: glycoside hydrolase family 95 protein [Bacteroidaceae bacterium]|nr:glycoside hydrolase family 95 protein [Bacteroidaceae bacterium]
MKKIVHFFFAIIVFAAPMSGMKTSDILWYQQPASKWMEALPIGNGRLGGMVYGGTAAERFALDESTLWSGQPNPDQDKPFGRERLDSLRQLFFDGKIKEANDIAWNQLNGNQTSFGTHLPAGEVTFRFAGIDERHVTDYRRQLDLSTAMATTTFRHRGVTYERQAFASHPDEVIVYRFTASKRGKVSFTTAFQVANEMPCKTSTHSHQPSAITFSGQALFPMHGPGGVHFAGRIAVKADGGKVTTTDSTLTIAGANEALVIIDFRTDYKRPAFERQLDDELSAALARSFTTLHDRHVADYSLLYSRVTLSLRSSVGCDSVATKPTDERRLAALKGAPDPALDALFFQMGRYLTIASSREDSPLPIALQGFFNDNLACHMGWTNDYHLDINTQQNYWAANVANLAECNSPLFRWIADLVEPGSRTAQIVYGCKGWTAHTTANIWGYTAPSSCIAWGLHPTAGSWIASQLWTHYQYTQDSQFLRTVAYPLLKGNAEFLLDYMTIDPRTGTLVTGPSISPENAFGYGGSHYSASMMPTCDRVFAWEILNACLQSARILGIDADFRTHLEHALRLFPDFKIGRDGGLQEWADDYDQAYPNHRHTSHLMSFWPYAQITLQHDPRLAKAVRRTFDLRLAAEGWEDVEWSRANAIGVYARLADADEAYRSLKMLEGYLSRGNLLTVSPAGIAGAEDDIFAIDGNTAGAAGIAEMLLQTQNGYLQLLPALPAAWSEGSFSGLCIRGGAEVACEWKDGRIVRATLTATASGTFAIEVPRHGAYAATLGNDTLQQRDGIWQVTLQKGQTVTIQ